MRSSASLRVGRRSPNSGTSAATNASAPETRQMQPKPGKGQRDEKSNDQQRRKNRAPELFPEKRSAGALDKPVEAGSKTAARYTAPVTSLDQSKLQMQAPK